MLTIEDVQALPEKYPVEVTALYPNFTAMGRPMNLFIRFKEVAPELWAMLATETFELAPAVEGIRQADGTLFPAYRERLAAVNELRKAQGCHLFRE